ncbi:hypothetical protein Bca4012_071748 [Brassica carinata]|uniref:Uncharacterized protein n=1 Tax=Brassica carinata TaxID=52824 RepID=A0A8X7QIV1_BRACI|nr:hypothetical protein Bca52824_064010 [Brassica carinata]
MRQNLQSNSGSERAEEDMDLLTTKHQKFRDLSCKYIKLHHWRGSKLLFDGDDEHGHDKGVEHENNRGLESTRVDEQSQYGEDLGLCFTVAWRLDCSEMTTTKTKLG